MPMVMVEYSERFGTDEVALYENVPYGKCIVLPGEDVKTGDIVLKAGTRIGPAQAGTLAALGVVQVPVFKPWKVGSSIDGRRTGQDRSGSWTGAGAGY